jgi:hypothetical protein
MKTIVYGVDAKNIVARLRLFGNTYRRIAKMTGISKVPFNVGFPNMQSPNMLQTFGMSWKVT